MAVTFYPKRLLITATALAVIGSATWLATDLRRGLVVGVMGVLAVLAYVFIEVLVTANPAAWWQLRRNGRN